jgi:hypothetical protein
MCHLRRFMAICIVLVSFTPLLVLQGCDVSGLDLCSAAAANLQQVTANLVGVSQPIQQDNPLRFGPSVVKAQSKTCPDVVNAALTATDKHCVSTGRNKVCLGNASVQADTRPGTPKIKFTQPGDTTNVSGLQALRLGQYDPAASTWGIALMRLQANLPDSAPGQNLTLLLFGDVALGETPGAVTAAATGTQPAATTAPTVKPSPTPKGVHPLQAFYFRTGIGEEGCAEAPHDGILVQSPQGLKQKVVLTVNEVRLDIREHNKTGAKLFRVIFSAPTFPSPKSDYRILVRFQRWKCYCSLLSFSAS